MRTRERQLKNNENGKNHRFNELAHSLPDNVRLGIRRGARRRAVMRGRDRRLGRDR